MKLKSKPDFSDRRTTLEHLRAFVAIVEDGSFASAGTRLHRTQSAVTQNLRKLEQILGCKLLERKQGRIIGLTDEGERFLPQVKEILCRVSNAIDAIQRPSMKGLIRLGVPDDFSVKDVHRAISCCLEMNPHLRIVVRSSLSENIQLLFNSNELDVAIFRITQDHESQHMNEHKILVKDELHWSGRDNTHFKKLNEVPLVLFPDGCPYRSSVIKILNSHNMPYRFAYTSSSYDNVRGAVMAGLGVAVLPKSAIRADCTILGGEHGFPALPETQLVLAVRPQEDIYRQFSEYLVRSCSLESNDGMFIPSSVS